MQTILLPVNPCEYQEQLYAKAHPSTAERLTGSINEILRCGGTILYEGGLNGVFAQEVERRSGRRLTTQTSYLDRELLFAATDGDLPGGSLGRLDDSFVQGVLEAIQRTLRRPPAYRRVLHGTVASSSASCEVSNMQKQIRRLLPGTYSVQIDTANDVHPGLLFVAVEISW